jgi:hypothetical protein
MILIMIPRLFNNTVLTEDHEWQADKPLEVGGHSLLGK